MIKSHGLSVLHDAVASLPMVDTSGTLSEQLREFGDSSVKISTMQDEIGLYTYFKVVEVAEVAVRICQDDTVYFFCGLYLPLSQKWVCFGVRGVDVRSGVQEVR